MMTRKNPFDLPDKMKVKIKIGESGKYLINLPDLNVFTECKSKEQIDEFVNDLIYCYFDIPKPFRNKVIYKRTGSALTDISKEDRLRYGFYVSPEMVKQYLT